MHDSGVEDSTFQLVIDQLEELVVTVIEEIRERPTVALAIFAGLLGAFVGSRLASRSSHSPQAKVAKTARGIGDVSELAGLGMQLFQNPVVRALLMAALERQLKRRLAL